MPPENPTKTPRDARPRCTVTSTDLVWIDPTTQELRTIPKSGGEARTLAALPGAPGAITADDHFAYVMLHGTLQHDLYHAGQIALLKNLTAQG